MTSSTGAELWQRFLEAQKNGDGDCSSSPAYQCPWTKDTFVDITDFSDMVKSEKHAAHVLLWCPARDTDQMVDNYPLKYRIPMQLRFDGKLGFPGGLVDEMVNFVPKDFEEMLDILKKGCLREVQEEMTISVGTQPKYVYSSCSSSHFQKLQVAKDGERVPGYVMHFFSCEVPITKLENMEKNFLEILSSDEVLGLTRVPLYFMHDNIRGLPAFLGNNFVGNALEQLVRTCLVEKFLTEEQVRFAYFVASTQLPQLKPLTK